MINLLRPKYLFPIQGEYRELVFHTRVAMEVVIFTENIFIPKRGTVMEYQEGDFVPASSVSAGDVKIDGNAIGDVGNIVPSLPWVLSEDRIFIVALTVNPKEKKLFPSARAHPWFLSMSRRVRIFFVKLQLVNQSVEDYLNQDSFDWGELKVWYVTTCLSSYLNKPNAVQPSYQS